jgi:putative protein kinase ArgK-like GTPase of G3E family
MRPADLGAHAEAVLRGRGRARERAAARLMSVLEAEPHRVVELFRLLPQDTWPRPRLVAGITGAPGTGKSTLVDAIIAELRQRDAQSHIGVIAVDPSSPSPAAPCSAIACA